jgi:hypothetical protein
MSLPQNDYIGDLCSAFSAGLQQGLHVIMYVKVFINYLKKKTEAGFQDGG